MATTTNYGWTTPDDTALVKDGASAIRTLGTAIDTTTFNNAAAAIAKTIVDAKGDIIAATAADTVSRLAVGANDTVLTADSAQATGLKWATPESGGMTLINSGGTTLTGSTVTISSIPATFKNLQLVIRNYLPSSDGAQMKFRFNADATANRHASLISQNSNSGYGETSATCTQGNDNVTGTGLAIIDIYDYANTATRKFFIGQSAQNLYTDATQLSYVNYSGFYNQIDAISSIQLLLSGGSFTSGTVFLYGVK